MDVLIISNFCGYLDDSDNNRFVYIADMLSANGFEVELITSDFNHGKKEYFTTINRFHNFNVTMLHQPSYSKNICLKRFFAHFKWGSNVFKYLKKRKKPDVVYCAIPSLAAARFAGKYCQKNKIRFIVDIQDLWPEAFRMAFNIPIVSTIIFSPFKMIANSAYKKADEIIAVSQTYLERALEYNKKVKKGYSVFLGTDLGRFDAFLTKESSINKEKDEIWIGYCGTLGASYDLNLVFDSLRLCDDKRIKFIVMGKGPREDEFKRNADGLNVLFLGRVEYGEMCRIIKKCDIVVNPITIGAAQSIINKHADYAASGKPVINTQDNSEYCSLVEKYNMGLNVIKHDKYDFAKKIELLCNNPDLRNNMGLNARKCADELFNRKVTYMQIIDAILGSERV